jgi:hypothetical protein
MNLSLSKKFYIGERKWLQFRWEAFNLTNHANVGQPVDSVDTATAARVMQFGLRVQF